MNIKDLFTLMIPILCTIALIWAVVGPRRQQRRVQQKVAALQQQEREAYASDAWAGAGWTDDRYRRGPSYATVVDEGDDHPPF